MMRVHRIFIGYAVLAAGAIGVALAQEPQVDQRIAPAPSLTPQGEPPAVAAPAARVAQNQYKTLLKTLEVPDDRTRYGDFYNYGYWSGTSYAGHDDLPAGYWVYLSPNWYIFKEAAEGPSAPQLPRPWGPEQATGAPDTWPRSGDLTTAWASKTPDGQREWLELTYDAPIRPVAVMVYETFNPGAVDRVTGYDANGQEVELWSGADPTSAGSEKGISIIPLHPEFDLTRIRVYVDSPKVAGWNEIDAVGLLDAAGTTHWAKSATASSTYADLAAQPGDVTDDLPNVKLRARDAVIYKAPNDDRP